MPPTNQNWSSLKSTQEINRTSTLKNVYFQKLFMEVEEGKGKEDTLIFLENFAAKILQNVFGRHIFTYWGLLARLQRNASKILEILQNS